MQKNKISLRRLFSNTKFLMVFSIVVAFIFWIIVALEYAPIIENVIEGVPVKIMIENSVPDKLGLQIFGQKNYTVDITVKGSRYIVGGKLLSANDFDVTAQTAYVDSAGNHHLQVKATIKDTEASYEIVSLSEDYIDVFFDKPAEKEMSITPNISDDIAKYVEDDYIFNKEDVILSASTVSLFGPESEIERINGVFADIMIDNKLTECLTINAPIRLSSENGEEIKYVKINNQDTLTVPVNLPIYKVETLTTAVSFKHSPSAFVKNPLSYTCSPSTVNVAVLQNGSNDDKTISVGEIDFATLRPDNNDFVFDAKKIKNAKILDSTETINVSVSLTDINQTTVKLDKNNIKIQGADAGKDYTINYLPDIIVVGKSDSLSKINSSSISGVVSLTNSEVSSSGTKAELTLKINGADDCWIFGTYYVNVY